MPGKDEKEVSGLRKFSHLRPACSDGKGHMTDPLVKWPGDLLIIERAALVQKLAAKAQDSYPDLYVPCLKNAKFGVFIWHDAYNA